MKTEGFREGSSNAHSGAAPPRGGTWLVLGGGGLKGLAHIGAWEAIVASGMRIDGIVGTSIGALIGALAASGVSIDELKAHALRLDRARIAKVSRRAVWINGIRQVSVFQGHALRTVYESLLPREGWNAMRIPLLMNAVDLADGSTAWFGTGERQDVTLVDAVYASAALPVLYPPLLRDGHAYVDGGIREQLALSKVAQLTPDKIIAIDVGSSGDADVGQLMSGGMIAVHQRVIAIMMAERRRESVMEWEGPPLVYVRPKLTGFGTFDFEHVPYFLEEGKRATAEALGP